MELRGGRKGKCVVVLVVVVETIQSWLIKWLTRNLPLPRVIGRRGWVPLRSSDLVDESWEEKKNQGSECTLISPFSREESSAKKDSLSPLSREMKYVLTAFSGGPLYISRGLRASMGS